MNKIPVRQTIVSAYAFLFAHIGPVLMLTGLPALLFVAADYAVQAYYAGHRAEIVSQDPQASAAYFLVTTGASLVMLLARAIAAVGVVRMVLGMEHGLTHPLDRTALRMFAADIRFWLGVIVLVALAAAVTAVGFFLAGAPLDTPTQIQPTAATFLAGSIAWFIFVYAFVTALRMGLLLPAVVVAEKKAGLARSHDLTPGNVLRLLAIGAALGLPIFVLLVAAEAAVVGSALTPDSIAQGDVGAIMQIAEDAIGRNLLPWEIYNAVVFVLYSGLFYSGAVYAYRAIMPGSAASPSPIAK